MQVTGNPLNPFGDQFLKPQASKLFLKTGESSHLCYDKIFEFLKEKGVLDSTGRLSEDFQNFLPPDLQNTQIERFNSIFSKTRLFIIENTPVEIQFTLEALFKFLKKDTIEIVGSTVFWILGADYLKRVTKELNLPEDLFEAHFFQEFERPAADIDIRVYLEPSEDPANFTHGVALFFQKQIMKTYHEALKLSGFTKFYIQKDPATGEHFSIVAFKTADQSVFDLVFIKKLARNHLFEHDAMKIEARYFSRPFRTLHLCSNSSSILRSLLLKMSKVLDTEDVKNINVSGAYMLISYLAKGWRYHSQEIEEALLLKVFEEKSSLKLKSTLKNHFPKHPFAPLIFCFYMAHFVPDQSKNIFENHVNELLPQESKTIKTSKPSLLQKMWECIASTMNHEGFLFISHYLQIFAHLLYMFKKDGEELETDVAFTLINGSKCLQLKLTSSDSPPLYLTMKENFSKSLSLFKRQVEQLGEESKVKLLPLFQSMMQFIEIDFKKTVLNEIEWEEAKKWIFEYWESKDPFLHELGFYLLSCLGAKEKSTHYLPDLLKGLFSLLEKEPIAILRKNKFEAFLYYWQHSSEEELGKNLNEIQGFNTRISKIDYNPKNLKKDFAFAFASLKNPALTGWILNVADSLEEDELLEFAKKKIQSPEEGIKFLRRFLKDLKIENAKGLFLFVLNHYLDLKNKILLDQDAEELASLATHFLKSLSPKEVMKETEKKAYLKLLQTLLSQDFMKGVTFQKLLEEKKICSREFSQLLDGMAPDEKAALILKQHQHLPIDYRIAPPNILKDRLALLLSCPFEQLTEKLFMNIREELSTFLVQVVRQKKALAQNFKSLLQPKLEWILLYLLEIQENILDYFKICKEFDPSIALKPSLLLALSACLKKQKSETQDLQTLLSIQDYFKSLETTSKKSPSRQLSLEQVSLYQLMAGLFLKNSDAESAFGYVQDLIFDMKAKKELPNDAFMTLLDACIELLLEKENSSLALTLLNMFEKTCETVKILNERKHWRALLLNFKEDPLRVSSALLEKQVFFKGDQEIEEKAEVTAKSLLSSSKIHETLFVSALNLIKAYSLNKREIINCIQIASSQLTNKKLRDETFYSLLSKQLPMSWLTPFFEFYLKEPHVIYLLLLKDIPSLIERLKKEKSEGDKHHCLTILTKGFLSLLNDQHPSYKEIVSTLDLLLDELKNNPHFSKDQKIEIELATAEAYKNSSVRASHQLGWTYLQELAVNPDIMPHMNQVLPLFSTLFSTSLNWKENDFAPSINQVIKSLKIDASNFKFLNNSISKNTPLPLLEIVINFAKHIISECPEKDPMQLNEPYLSFKADLKKLILLLMEQKNPSRLEEFFEGLLINVLFTKKEVQILSKPLAAALFNDPETIKDAIKIESAFGYFIISIRDPLPSNNSIMQQVLRHIMALLFTFKAEDQFATCISLLSDRLFAWMRGDCIYELFLTTSVPQNTALLYLFRDVEQRKLPTPELLNAAKNNCFEFLLYLIDAISTTFSKKGNSFNQGMIIMLMNCSNYLVPLITLFPERKSEILQAVLNCYYAAAFLPHDTPITAVLNSDVIRRLDTFGFFNKLDKKTEKLGFKINCLTRFGEGFVSHKKFNLKESEQVDIIVETLKELSNLKTLRGLIIAHIHYCTYYEILVKNKKTGELESHFAKLFKTQYPHETRDYSDMIKIVTEQFLNLKLTYPEMPL